MKAFLEEAAKRSENSGATLPSYLITPVQRLPRYEAI
jgi:hypothetical protein